MTGEPQPDAEKRVHQSLLDMAELVFSYFHREFAEIGLIDPVDEEVAKILDARARK